MGPQSGSCGYFLVERDLSVLWQLQWVHSLVAVVIGSRAAPWAARPAASMGPQSGSCGYPGHCQVRPGTR